MKKNNSVYEKGAATKKAILDTALDLAKKHGYHNIRREQVAKASGVSKPLVSLYFVNVAGLRKEIMLEAIRLKVLPVIGQGLVIDDETAHSASEDLKRRAYQSLSEKRK